MQTQNDFAFAHVKLNPVDIQEALCKYAVKFYCTPEHHDLPLFVCLQKHQRGGTLYFTKDRPVQESYPDLAKSVIMGHYLTRDKHLLSVGIHLLDTLKANRNPATYGY